MTNAMTEGRPLTNPPRRESECFTLYRTLSSRVISSPPDVTTCEQMNLVEISGILRFWNEPEEDRYTHDDGKAV